MSEMRWAGGKCVLSGGMQGAMFQRKLSLLSCRLAQNPALSLQLPSTSIHSSSLTPFPNVCPPSGWRLHASTWALLLALPLGSWPLAHVPLIGWPGLLGVRSRPIQLSSQQISFCPESLFSSFCTEINHLQPTPESAIAKSLRVSLA